ncbi:hypothetical protein [Sphingopyxis alaskensis]|uniref:hypothetical protein n=1 Tax=Sphingopyxis alaskensis TaxID=117207 RepID=UPI00391B47CA
MVWTVFEYLYRDADNHKAFGKVAFRGWVSPAAWDRAFQKLHDRTCFIAEQVGLPSLCGQLYRWSGGGPSDADHCWQEFVSVYVVEGGDLPPAIPQLGETRAFVEHISAIEVWNIWLSPNVERGTSTQNKI